MASLAYLSQFLMPLPWLHPQLLMFPLFPIFHCQSHPILLFIHPFKNWTWTWSQKRLLNCQIGSMIYQKKSIFQYILNPLLKCKYISLMIKKKIYNTSMNHKLFCYCYWDIVFLCYSYPKVNGLNKSSLFPWYFSKWPWVFSMGCYAYLKFLMHLVLSLNSKSSVFPRKMIMCHNEKKYVV